MCDKQKWDESLRTYRERETAEYRRDILRGLIAVAVLVLAMIGRHLFGG